MNATSEKWGLTIELLRSIESELKTFNDSVTTKVNSLAPGKFVHVPFRGAEIYFLHKAFIDSGGAPTENYKSLLEKTVGVIANKTQIGLVRQVFASTVARWIRSKAKCKTVLQKMIRNIESYE